MDICLDCKDKVVKFYHFKRKVKETQQTQQKSKTNYDKQQSSSNSRIVHNIYKIIESYAEKCAVSAIRVQEDSKKLIIESNETDSHRVNNEEMEIKQEPESDLFEEYEEQVPISEGSLFSDDLSRSNSESVIMIKEEPDDDDLSEIVYQNSSSSIVNSPILQRQPSSSSTTVPVARKRTSSLTSMQQLSTNGARKYQHSISRSRRSKNHRRSEVSLTAAALKMRQYREKLKQPENRDKFLQHQQKQKEWNRQYYQRKLMKDMLSGSDSNQFMFS